LHNLSASFVLGYHGCDRRVGLALLDGLTQFAASQNEWDWLGSGIYFWEVNPLRGLEFAHEQKNAASSRNRSLSERSSISDFVWT
jgi:hypothetical protein